MDEPLHSCSKSGDGTNTVKNGKTSDGQLPLLTKNPNISNDNQLFVFDLQPFEFSNHFLLN